MRCTSDTLSGCPVLAAANKEIEQLRELVRLADKAIYEVVDEDMPLVCDPCAVEYFNARQKI